MKWIRVYREPAVEPPVGAPPVSIPGASASVSLPLPPAGTPPETPPAKPETPPAFALPDAYKDKPYLKGVDSMDKVFKMLDGAQELIGKRPAGIPGPDATPEDKAKFYDALGRPKTAGEYVFDGADKADPKFLPKVQEAFHKHGLSAEQAKGIYADINGALAEFAKEAGLAAQQQDVNFDELANKTFGVNRDKVLSISKALLDANVSPSMKEHVAKLSNENLIVLADVLNNINAKYIKQDAAPGGSPTAVGLTPASVSAKGRELMMSEAYNNPFHANHAQVVQQVKEIYGTLK